MSRRTVRLAALTGAAAVALGVATPVVAAAAEHTATVHTVAATATPIRHAGRTVTVVMPTTHYTATTSHRDAVVTLAAAGPSALPVDTITGTAPGNIAPAYQTNVSSSSGGIGAGIVGTLVVAVIVYFGVKHNKVSVAWGVVFVFLGLGLAQTSVGSMLDGLKVNVVSTAASMLNSF